MISIGREYKKNKKKGNDKSLPKKNHFLIQDYIVYTKLRFRLTLTEK